MRSADDDSRTDRGARRAKPPVSGTWDVTGTVWHPDPPRRPVDEYGRALLAHFWDKWQPGRLANFAVTHGEVLGETLTVRCAYSARGANTNDVTRRLRRRAEQFGVAFTPTTATRVLGPDRVEVRPGTSVV